MFGVKSWQEQQITERKPLTTVGDGGKEAVNALCDHPDIKAISFVGSALVGTQVYTRASGTGKRAQCMMAANNHGIVLPDADREFALNAMIGACFGASAQRCMAIHTLVLVGQANDWLPDFVEKAKTLNVGPGCCGAGLRKG